LNTSDAEMNYSGGDLDAISSLIDQITQALEDARSAIDAKNFAESRAKLDVVKDLLEITTARIEILEEIREE